MAGLRPVGEGPGARVWDSNEYWPTWSRWCGTPPWRRSWCRYPERVQARYQAWLLAQEGSGRQFSLQQRWWLDEIARHIGINVSIRVEDLNAYGFQARGGQVAAARLFGVELGALLDDLYEALEA